MSTLERLDQISGSTALRTDHYELTMIDAALGSGVARHRAVFEVFSRSLPAGRRYGVVGGTARLLDALEHFRFDPDQLEWAAARGIVSPEALDHLAGWTFDGDIDGYREGDVYFPGSPVLTVEADFASAVVLETLCLSIFNHDSAVLAAASRMRTAAGDHRLLEAGSRRTSDATASAASRAAWIGGFDATSNLEAGFLYGVPTGGTAAHAFTLAHADERLAFEAQVARFGPATTFLVDTYDTATGVRHAIEASGGALAQVRIDSGDLVADAVIARRLLDEAGATQAQIMVSGDLDEFRIAEMRTAGAPIDSYEVGKHLVTGSGHPTAGFVYKLVAIADAPGAVHPLRPVAKRAQGKGNVGGRKVALRQLDADGIARAERTVPFAPSSNGASSNGAGPPSDVRLLQVPLVRRGVRVDHSDAADARRVHEAARAELGPDALDLTPGPPALVVDVALPA